MEADSDSDGDFFPSEEDDDYDDDYDDEYSHSSDDGNSEAGSDLHGTSRSHASIPPADAVRSDVPPARPAAADRSRFVGSHAAGRPAAVVRASPCALCPAQSARSR